MTSYKGTVSSRQYLCGGGPQGSLLVVLLFVLQVDKAGEPCPRTNLTPSLPPDHYGPEPEPTYCSPVKPYQNEHLTHKKLYIDDLTELVTLKVNISLMKMDSFVGQLNFYAHCGLEYPKQSFILQHKLKDIQVFTEKNMIIQ